MERIRRRNAIRAVSSTAVKATAQAALVEIAELNEQINVDVDVSHRHIVSRHDAEFCGRSSMRVFGCQQRR